MPSQSLARLKHLLGLSSAAGTWRLLALIFALLNLKSWPLMWHIRLLTTLIRHTLPRPTLFTPLTGPPALFAPLITHSRSPLLECDYNLHKSNSSYFSDLDVARAHLVAALCARGMAGVGREARDEEPTPGSSQGREGQGTVKVMLGGVGCAFRREVGMYQGYEIWTRVLAWDRKWLYLVSHFVQPGAVRPSGYLLQSGGGKPAPPHAPAGSAAREPHPAIFASSIAKYVFKKGRRTIAPARVLSASGLLPDEPASTSPSFVPHPTPDTSSITAATSNTTETGLSANGPGIEAVQSLLDASVTAEGGTRDGGEWRWEEVERERVRGMKVAGLMGELDEGLSEEFRAEGEEAGEVLGRYWG